MANQGLSKNGRGHRKKINFILNILNFTPTQKRKMKKAKVF